MYRSRLPLTTPMHPWRVRDLAACCSGSRAVTLGLIAVFAVAWGACTTVRVTASTRSSIEQRLISRAVERAAALLDVRPLQDRVVDVELHGLTADESFARELLRARLEARGIRMARGGATSAADVTLRVFAAAIAVDTAETLLGLPAMQAPVLAVPVPEIALFKWERSRGHAELQSYIYDANGRLIERVSDALGEAKWDRFTVLIFVSFAVTDLDRPPPAP